MFKIFILGAVLIFGSALFLTGCGKSEMPNSFAFSYTWYEGTVPPPYYYEYRIDVNQNGVGKLSFAPDYPYGAGSETVPIWIHDFELTSAQMNKIYDLSVGRGLHKKKWAEMGPEKVGGSYSTMEIRMGAEKFEISGIANEDARAKELFLAVRGLIDKSTMDKMLEKKKTYDVERGPDN